MPRDLLAGRQPRDLLAGQTSRPSQGDDGGSLGFLNRGISQMLGAPVDLVNAGLGAVGLPVSETPFGGSEAIGRGLSRLGARVAPSGARPDSIGDYVGQGLGGAVGALLPGAGATALAARSASPLAQGVAGAISRPFLATPGRALTAEALAGAGAGAGEDVASRLSDSPYARMAGALVGGMAGGAGPAAISRAVQMTPVAGTGIRMIQREIAPFTERGAMERARSRVGGLVEDRDAARRNLDAPTIGQLSPATSTGDRRLMALEQAVRSENPSADLAMREAETAASAMLRDELNAPSQGVGPEATRRFASQRVESLVNRMNERVARAEQQAAQRVARLSPERSQADASVVVREELETALREARGQERELWSSVPDDVMVPTRTAKQRYRDIVGSLPRAQRDDVPPKARDFLEDGGNQRMMDEEAVKEVHGLYSTLREAARNARAGDTPNRNMARIADELADALLEDISTVAEASQPLREAIDFSRQVNQRFTRGNVGRVLGNERTGGDRVADIQTLDRTIGRSGRSGAVAMDEMARALEDRMSGVEPAMGDYMRGRFADTAVRDGQVRSAPAETFMSGNRDTLERMPRARQDIVDAILASDTANRVRGTMGARAQNVQRNSAATTLTGARPGEEIRAILRSQNPQETAAQLARQARRDPSGQAALGLKGALIDDLINSARRAEFDEAGEAMLSGRALQARLQDGPIAGVAREILSEEELSRVRQIADEFRKIETMQGRLPGVGEIMGDEPNSLVSYLARVLAARSGAQMGQGTSGASLQTAQMASRRMQRILESLTNDRAERLIVQAVTGDRDLFRLLLADPRQMTRQQENRLIEALGGVAGAEAADAQNDNSAMVRALSE